MTHVAINGHSIVLAAVHSAGAVPLDLVEATARVKAALDAAGIRYSVREFSATIGHDPPRSLRHPRRRLRGR